MDEQILNESRYEQAPAAGENDEAVRLITIQKAKGSEYPVVFVPDLNVGNQPIKDSTLNRLDMGLVTKIQPGSQAEANDDEDDQSSQEQALPRSFAVARWLEDMDQRQEVLRKYYVALTRHEDYLVLVGADWRNKAGGLRAEESFLARLDGLFDIGDALRNGGEIRYHDGGDEFVASVFSQSPRRAYWTTGRGETPGEAMLSQADDAQALEEGLEELAARAQGDNMPLLGPLSNSPGPVELAATALVEYAKCPAMYHWRYELRAPIPDCANARPGLVNDGLDDISKAPKDMPVHRLDPMTIGTLLHGCMEFVDFATPQRADSLLARALARLGTEEAENLGNLDALVEDLETMLMKFRSSELGQTLASLDRQDIHREVDFVSEFGQARVRGQIDLLYRSGGRWHVVDYKSDDVSARADALEAKARQYEMQMLIYAQAVARYTAELPAGATLYFLRTGRTWSFDITPAALEEVMGRVESLARELLASGRSGEFRKCGRADCDYCRVF
jgi:ATP-dependent helicase/nuclease subunit A